MKHFYTVVCTLLLSYHFCSGQYVNIPDSNFRNRLIAYFPQCFNSSGMLDTTCATIISQNGLTVNQFNIKNLDGVQYFKNLTYLDCSQNAITNFPQLPSTLLTLNCSFCQLTQLPPLPSSLQHLNCLANPLGTLPALPANLNELVCVNCQLTALPTLPASLRLLNCGANQLTSLPPLPDAIMRLDCWNNRLTSLPVLPSQLYQLWCGNNLLNQLPAILPESIGYINCFNNDIYCLPFLTAALTTLVIDTAKIKCLPNKPYNLTVYHDANANSISRLLCNGANSLAACPPHYYPAIQGNIFYDMNSNGIKDGNELYKTDAFFWLSDPFMPQNYANTYSNDSGFYNINTRRLGPATLTLSNAPAYYTAVPGNMLNYNFYCYDTVVVSGIALQPNTVISKVKITNSASPLAERDSVFACPVEYRNIGTTVLSANIALNYNGTQLRFDSCSNPGVINTGSSLLIADPSFLPGKIGRFTAYFTVKNTVPLGSFINTTNTITTASASDVVTTNTQVTVLVVLPVQLQSFTGQEMPREHIGLRWVVTNESSVAAYIVEQSTDGLTYKATATLPAKGQTVNVYAYEEPRPSPGNVYYRLRIKEINGGTSYSPILKINAVHAWVKDIVVGSNPVRMQLSLQVNDAALSGTKAVLVNATGVPIMELVLQKGVMQVNVSNLPNGMFYLHSSGGSVKIVIAN